MVRKLVIALCVVVVIALIASFGAISFFDQWKHRKVVPTAEVAFTIERGESFRQIAENLERSGLIDRRHMFHLLGWLEGELSSIQAGEYLFSRPQSPISILDKLTTGQVAQFRIRLPEGGTFRKFKELLSVAEKLSFDLHESTAATVLVEIGMADEITDYGNAHAEGWFFPDTYAYSSGELASDVLKRSLDRMTDELNAIWKDAEPSKAIANRYELLILASIVEKETSIAEDRFRVSGVFTRRLEKGMKLQADPTVIYGLGERFDGNLKRSDLRLDTPYNTYLHVGLPPTPIASPSADALYAAANPASGDELFFVGRGDGTTQFSKTLSEHNRAVERYQLGDGD
ncbi:MAG: endolytic transglycosylase MltG [Gammaproteobacteria bacterium]|nr:endolytic transglycosylase MltG [Gammaproteobacteria bacterium]